MLASWTAHPSGRERRAYVRMPLNLACDTHTHAWLALVPKPFLQLAAESQEQKPRLYDGKSEVKPEKGPIRETTGESDCRPTIPPSATRV